MNWRPTTLFMLVRSIPFAFYVRAALRSDDGREGTRCVIAGEPEQHLVTRATSETSRTMLGGEAPAFTLPGDDGATYSLAELLRLGPVVLTFTKVGCPCSEAAQPLFNRVEAAYPGVRMIGVVNAEPGQASLWLREIKPSYPHVLDPDLELVKGYGVENSAATAGDA